MFAPVCCPYCGTPLPRIFAGQTWHARNRARRILDRHLSPDTKRQCLPLEQPRSS